MVIFGADVAVFCNIHGEGYGTGCFFNNFKFDCQKLIGAKIIRIVCTLNNHRVRINVATYSLGCSNHTGIVNSSHGNRLYNQIRIVCRIGQCSGEGCEAFICRGADINGKFAVCNFRCGQNPFVNTIFFDNRNRRTFKGRNNFFVVFGANHVAFINI